MKDTYRCMCRNDHEPIGYTRDDESCPLCEANERIAALEKVRVAAANFMALWDGGTADDVLVLDAAQKLRSALTAAAKGTS